jgi:nucleoside-diphosphate-sugar epimerase
MKVLVTGASGFVGQSLIEALKQQEVNIVSVGRQLRISDIDMYIPVPDFSAYGVWQAPLVGCDVVIHLAARVHVMHDLAENPLEEFLAVNLHGTVSLATAAAKAGVKRFVYVSSIKVNGEFTKNEKFSETDIPNPQDPYAISKWQAEQALRKIEKETGMEVVVLRPPLIYGAGVKANFASLLKLVYKGLPLPLANINNKRSLIYLGNLVDAIITCAKHPKAAGQTYLVSDGEDTSIAQLVKQIAISLNRPRYVFPFPVSIMRIFAKLMGKTASVNRLTQSLVIDSSKIRKELNWQPPFSMTQGLKITADWYRKSLGNERV